jgi:glucose/arabinose dehydrogenase
MRTSRAFASAWRLEISRSTMRWWLTSVGCAAVLFVSSCQSAQPSATTELELELVASGFDKPLGLTHAGDGSERLFVLEQGGTIRIIEGDAALDVPFLDISNRISCCGERGLLGLAFDPDYSNTRHFFINYTGAGGDTVVARFTTSSSNPNRADPDSELVLLTFSQPFSNHNGGHVAFGPDGYLYIGTGDGGSGGDPQNNAQNLGNLLGKVLRIDIRSGTAEVPFDNPFVGRAGSREEIWAYGLRNPWRFSFDRLTGDLLIADVGQNSIEEINFQSAASTGGENYGWRLKEGSRCFDPPSNCTQETLVDPVLEYGHDEGCSVTGGFRSRARPSSGLDGVYLFGDFCRGTIWGGFEDGDGSWSRRVLAETDLSITSFGEDESARIYVVDRAGSVFRISPRASSASLQAD